jgi:hypothetical protein
MPEFNKSLAPQDLGELWDRLGWMMLNAPKFLRDESLAMLMPERNLATTMFELREGLGNVRRQLGEERYHTALKMADRMQTLFEADPDQKTGEARQGREVILEMENLLKTARRK